MMRGKSPVTTPDPQAMYSGGDQTQYFRVELTDHGAPTFLPSEARRVNTPPISKNKARGFFFDYKPPSTEDEPSAPWKVQRTMTMTLSDETPPSDTDRPRRVSGTGWYDVQLEAIEADAGTHDSFLTEIPDHLSNSPFCPRHPKNKSKGRGICPMHGRNEGVETPEVVEGTPRLGSMDSEQSLGRTRQVVY